MPTEARVYFQSVQVRQYSKRFVELCMNLARVGLDVNTNATIVTNKSLTCSGLQEIGRELSSHSLLALSLVLEPFLPNIHSHTSTPSVYPAKRTGPFYIPFDIFLTWSDPSKDDICKADVKRIEEELYTCLDEEGFEEARQAQVYANYAMDDTPLERVWAAAWDRLKELEKVDPERVMELTGSLKV